MPLDDDLLRSFFGSSPIPPARVPGEEDEDEDLAEPFLRSLWATDTDLLQQIAEPPPLPQGPPRPPQEVPVQTPTEPPGPQGFVASPPDQGGPLGPAGWFPGPGFLEAGKEFLKGIPRPFLEIPQDVMGAATALASGGAPVQQLGYWPSQQAKPVSEEGLRYMARQQEYVSDVTRSLIDNLGLTPPSEEDEVLAKFFGAVGEGMGQIAPALLGGGSWITMSMIGAKSISATYEDGIQKGLEPEEATARAVRHAFGETALEIIPLARLQRMLGFNTKKAGAATLAAMFPSVKDVVKQAGIEGLEEMAQYYWGVLDDAIFTGIGEGLVPENLLRDLLFDGTVGAMVGLMSGSVPLAVHSMRNKGIKKAVEGAIKATEEGGSSVQAFRDGLMSVEGVDERVANWLTLGVVGKVAELRGQDLESYLRETVSRIVKIGDEGVEQVFEVTPEQTYQVGDLQVTEKVGQEPAIVEGPAEQDPLDISAGGISLGYGRFEPGSGQGVLFAAIEELLQRPEFQVIQGEGKFEDLTEISDEQLFEETTQLREKLEALAKTAGKVLSQEPGPEREAELMKIGGPLGKQFVSRKRELQNRLYELQKLREQIKEEDESLREQQRERSDTYHKRMRSGFFSETNRPVADISRLTMERKRGQKKREESLSRATRLVVHGADALGIKDLGSKQRPVGLGPEVLEQREGGGPEIRSAIRLDDGTVLQSPKDRPTAMHLWLVEAAAARGIPISKVVGSGWTIDGAYTERALDEDPYVIEQERDRVREKRAGLPPVKTLTVDQDMQFHEERPIEEYEASEGVDEVEELYQEDKGSTNFRKTNAAKFMKAREGTKYVDMLTPLTAKDIRRRRLKVYLSADNTVGFTIDPKGDIGNVFNNRGPYGLGAMGVGEAMRLGGKTLDAFDLSSEGAKSGSESAKMTKRMPKGLPGFYSRFGFELYDPPWMPKEGRISKGRWKFDPAQAPKTFDQELFGQPDVVFMRLAKPNIIKGKETASTIAEEALETKFGKFKSLDAIAKYFDSQFFKRVARRRDRTPEERRSFVYANALRTAGPPVVRDEDSVRWYAEYHQEMIELFDRFFPGVREQPGLRSLVAVINGFLSNGEKPYYQTRNALWMLATWDGKGFATVNPWTKSKPGTGFSGRNVVNAVTRLNQMLADPRINYDFDKFHDLMLERKTMGEWVQWFKDSPTCRQTSISEMLVEDVVPGYRVFGPKVGRFTGNILGDESEVTADIWMKRWWLRMTGQAYDREKGEARSAMSVHEMRELRRTVAELADTFRITPAQMQAVIWVYEKTLWESMLGKPDPDISPKTMADRLTEEVGSDETWREKARKSWERIRSRYDVQHGAQARRAIDRAGKDARSGEAVQRAGKKKAAPAEEPQTLEQSRDLPPRGVREWKGKIRFGPGGRAEIRFNKNADVSTVIHEISHLARRTLPQEIQDELSVSMGLEPGDPWKREHEEKFADMMEEYFRTSAPPDPKRQEAWAAVYDRMQDIYRDAVRGVKTEDIPAPIRELFGGFVEAKATQRGEIQEAPVAGDRTVRVAKGKRGAFGFRDPALEKSWKKMRQGKVTDGRLARFRQWMSGHFRTMTRQHKLIPETAAASRRAGLPNTATIRAALRAIDNYASAALRFKVVNPYRQIVEPLTRAEEELLHRSMFVNHLAKLLALHDENTDREAEDAADPVLPAGWTRADVEAAQVDLQTELDANPKVTEAEKKVQDLWNGIREEVREAFSELGIATDFLDRQGDTYIHHQILNLEERRGAGRSVGDGFQRPWMRSLSMREAGLINLNFEQSQIMVLSQLALDAEIARQVARIRDAYDIMPEVREEAKRRGVSLDKVMREKVRSGYTVWTPQGSTIFFRAYALDESLANDILEGVLEDLTGEDVAAHMREVVAISSRTGMLLPTPFVETLTMGKDKKRRLLAPVMRVWKAWQLTSPRRIFRYVTRNLSGDLSKALSFHPDTAKYLQQSIRELTNVLVRGKAPGENLRQWLLHNGVDSGLMQQEYKASEAEKLATMLEPANLKNFLRRPWSVSRYLGFSRKWVSLLEATSRYAAYLSYLNQIEKNGKPSDWGASDPDTIRELLRYSKYEAAYMLANELLGAYDQVSEGGRGLRNHWFPFWSFQELNARTYWRLMKNAVSSDGISIPLAKKVLKHAGIKATFLPARGLAMLGVWAARAYMLEALLALWNNLLFPDEDEDLPEDVRRTSHITLGRDDQGNVRYFYRFATFAEFREWMGLSGTLSPQNLYDLWRGNITLQEFLQNAAEELSEQGPVQKIGQGLFGPFKTVAEYILGQSFFPNVLRPRQFAAPMGAGEGMFKDVDRWRQLAQSVGLREEFDAVAGIPSRHGGATRAEQWLNTIPEFFYYRAEPGWTQYMDVIGRKNRWMERNGEIGYSGGYWSQKTSYLRKYKAARRSGQADAARQYLLRYVSAGGTYRGIVQSFKRMDPLYGLDDAEFAAFVSELGPRGRHEMLMAIEYYDRELALSQEEKDFFKKVLPE